MSRVIVVLAGLTSAIAAPTLAESVPLDVRASTVVLEYWASMKANDGTDSKLVAEDATFAMMELGGRYDRAIMSELAHDCELVSMLGSKAKTASDLTAYVWGIIECASGESIDVVPIGFGIRDGLITQISVDLLTPVSVDRSILGEGGDR